MGAPITNTWTADPRNNQLSADWTSDANWSAFNPPGTADAAVLPGYGTPYTVTIGTADAPVTVGDIALSGAGATLDLAGTLTVGGSVALGTSAEMDLAGLFGGGTIDLGAGGVVAGDGGTADGVLLLGPASTVDGSGMLTEQGEVTWTTSGSPGDIVISTPDFLNLGQFALGAISQPETSEFVTGVIGSGIHAAPTYSELSWTQEIGAAITIASSTFVNDGLIQASGGTLDLTGGTFDNNGTISLAGVTTQSVQATGTSDGYATYSVVTSEIPTQVVIGGSLSFDNNGTIAADNIIFQQPVTLGPSSSLQGGLTFDSTLDMGGDTLTAGTIGIAGLAENGSIDGTGTLTLQGGATLDNVSIGAGVTVQTTGTGGVTVIDPPSTTQAITLNAVLNRVVFATVSTFDGSIVMGAGATNDGIGMLTPGGVTLGPDFSLQDAVADSLLTVGGSANVLNSGTLALNGASLEIAATLDGAGAIQLSNDATVAIAALAASANPSIFFAAGTSTVIVPGTGAIGGVLNGLTTGDIVDFAAVSSTPDPTGIFGTGTAENIDNTLDLVGASGDTARVALSSVAGGTSFSVAPDGSGGTLVTVACFAAGTRIATPGGDAAVETLRPGDTVRTAGGRAAPVRWVGWTRIDLARHPAAWKAAPIRVRAGAFAAGRPARDLLLSPEHCVLVGAELVPVCRLLNGATIARVDGLAEIVYWHLELDRHDVVLAEGLPAESYLDTGNRALFAGQAGARAMHPDFSGPPDAAALRLWAEHGCAVLRLTAAEARAALRARAEALGWRCAPDPGLTLLADGVPLSWRTQGESVWARLPAGTRLVRLLSRTFIPGEQDDGSADPRRLGLAVAAVRLAGWPPHPDSLVAGWSRLPGEAWRWTDGDAEIAVPKLARPTMLELQLHPLGRYWRAPETPAAPAAAQWRRLRM